MRFSRPEYLPLLWLLVPAILVQARGVVRKLHAGSAFARQDPSGGILPPPKPRRLVARRLLQCLALALLLLAAAGPELTSGQKPVRRKGTDVVFLLDVSNSMLARDVEPDRLSRAKFEMLQVSRSLGDGRRSLILFAGTPVVQCPLTGDQEFFESLLDMAAPALVESQGTVFRRAFEEALHLAGSGQARKGATVIVMASDGEDHAADFSGAASQMKTRGIRFYSIGIGSGEAAPIPLPADSSGAPRLKLDRSGAVVMTRFRPEVFSEIARQAGGRFFYSRPGSPVNQQLSAAISSELSTTRWVTEPDRRRPLHIAFIAAALLCYLLAEATTDAGRGRPAGRR